MKKLILSLIVMFSIPQSSMAQDLDLRDVINTSWCVNSKIVNQNGVVRDCSKSQKTPNCREQSSIKGSLIIISAVCSAR